MSAVRSRIGPLAAALAALLAALLLLSGCMPARPPVKSGLPAVTAS